MKRLTIAVRSTMRRCLSVGLVMAVMDAASATATGPGAIVRGGQFNSVISAGVFAIDAAAFPSTLGNSPASARPGLGFRCAR